MSACLTLSGCYMYPHFTLYHHLLKTAYPLFKKASHKNVPSPTTTPTVQQSLRLNKLWGNSVEKMVRQQAKIRRRQFLLLELRTWVSVLCLAVQVRATVLVYGENDLLRRFSDVPSDERLGPRIPKEVCTHHEAVCPAFAVTKHCEKWDC